MKYRSRTEIVFQILDIAKVNDKGMTKSKIMYKAFLNYIQLKEYLTVLTDNGLLEYNSHTQRFKTTEKGHRFLQIYNNIDNVIV
jgi:predicted transcriptional regulator